MPSLDVIDASSNQTTFLWNNSAETKTPVSQHVALSQKASQGGKSPSSKPLVKYIVKVVKRSQNQEIPIPCKRSKEEEPAVEASSNRSLVLKQPIMISRTNLKQQLMREQIQQLEQRERELSSSAPTHTSTAIKVPLYAAPGSLQVPRQVLMVKSKLENPTPYHVRESQQRQVREYLSHSHHNIQTVALPQSPRPTVNSLDPSPGSDFSAALSSCPTSPVELEEFWQDIQNSCTDSVVDNLLDPSLTVSTAPIDADILEVLSMLPTLDNVSSCPSGLTDVSEEGELLTDEKVQAFQKDRQKKDNHNRIERRRRFNINDRIKELGTLLPRSNDPYYDLVKDVRQNKGTILKASVDYVRCLKKEVHKIPQLELQRRLMEQVNKKLLLRIQSLELQLKANQIPVSETTWFPSTQADLNAIIKQEVLSGSSLNTPYHTLPNTAQEHSFSENNNNLIVASSDPGKPNGHTRKHLPIMQFLKVKQESEGQATPPSCSDSPSPLRPPSPLPPYSPFDDLMMEDDHPVTGDPMLSSRDTFSPENMDFMS